MKHALPFNMHRFSYLVLLFLFSSHLAFSQKLSVDIGDEVDSPPMGTALLGPQVLQDGNYLLGLREADFGANEAKLFLYFFDADLKLKASKKYESDMERSETLALAHNNGKLAWFTTQHSREEDSLGCFMAIGKVGQDFEAPKRLFKLFAKRSSFRQTPVKYLVSADSSKHVVIAITDKEEQDDRVELNLAVVDSAFNQYWNGRIELPYTERRLNAVSWAVLPNGDVCMLAKVYNSDRFGEALKIEGELVPDTKLVLFVFSKYLDKPKELELKLGNLFINGPAIFANRQNELICAGLYAKSHKGNSVGVFNIKFNPSESNEMDIHQHEFDGKDLNKFTKRVASQDRKGHWGLSKTFQFKKWHVGDDGKAFLLAEDTYDTYVSNLNNTGGASQRSRTYFSKNAVAVFQINAAGDFDSVGIVRKEQYLTTEIFGGFYSMLYKDDLFVFYNDHVDNLEKEPTEKIKTMYGFNKDTVPVVKIQSSDGSVRTKEVYDIRATGSLQLPKFMTKISNRELLMVAVKPNGLLNLNLQLIKVRISP